MTLKLDSNLSRVRSLFRRSHRLSHGVQDSLLGAVINVERVEGEVASDVRLANLEQAGIRGCDRGVELADITVDTRVGDSYREEDIRLRPDGVVAALTMVGGLVRGHVRELNLAEHLVVPMGGGSMLDVEECR